jgi:hypothetical protein
MTTPRNRDVKPTGTFDHPTKFAAVEKTAAGVTLGGPQKRAVGDLVSVLEQYDGDHINGRIVEDFGDGTYRVAVVGRDGRTREYFEAGFDLDEPLPYTYGDLVGVTDLDTGVRLTGKILRPGFGPGRWEVEVIDHDGSTYTADFHGANISPGTLADQAYADQDEHFPGTHPDFPGSSWGVSFSSHWQCFDVNHGYFGCGYETLFPRRRVFGHDEAGNEVLQPNDFVTWTTSAGHTAEEADVIWENRDAISAGLLKQGFGGGKMRVRIAVADDIITVGPYDWPDDFTAFTVPR